MLKTYWEKLPVRRHSGEIRFFQISSLLAIAIAFIHPPQGLGISICIFYNITSLPCPGCGFTRSVTNIFHGDLAHSFYFHPFGPLVALFMLFFAFSALFPPLHEWVVRNKKWLDRLMLVGSGIVLLFGIGRMVWAFMDPAGMGVHLYNFDKP